jgi:nucleoside-diphosphate-sugar epimerase
MATILMTGAGGFLGSALLEKLARTHQVVTVGRSDLTSRKLSTHYIGSFHDPELLKKLNAHAFDLSIHLAAVTGGCSERDGLMVNVEGTRVLLEYLASRGCSKAVLASSIAVVGIQSPLFRPNQVPIPDEHPCLDRDGYGLSKYLMEEITKYYGRQNPFLDIINLRLAALFPDDEPPPLIEPGKIFPWALGGITKMSLSDAVRAFVLAIEAPYSPGVKIYNAVSQAAWVKDSTEEVLRSWWKDNVDLSYFKTQRNPRASVFDATNIKAFLGFEA